MVHRIVLFEAKYVTVIEKNMFFHIHIHIKKFFINILARS